jgi:surfactin synthase thioesterase subunit
MDSRAVADSLLRCHVTCLTGSEDPAVSTHGWEELLTKDFHFEERFYSGNHFFIFDSEATDKAIAEDVRASCLKVVL